jgi:hypothetical protein
MVTKTYFTNAEARATVGTVVEALSDFPSVPKGSRGAVVKMTRRGNDQWAARVEWDLPRESSFVVATVLDASFNFARRARRVADEFDKSEFSRLLRVLEPVN